MVLSGPSELCRVQLSGFVQHLEHTAKPNIRYTTEHGIKACVLSTELSNTSGCAWDVA